MGEIGNFLDWFYYDIQRWTTEGGVLYISSSKHMVWWALLALVVSLFRQWLFFRFFFLKYLKENREFEERRGEEQISIPLLIFSVFGYKVIVAPFVEELLFRSPILWFLQQGRWLFAICLIPITATIFGLSHATNPKKQYTNKIFGGIIYGAITFSTYSLWPAIFTHLLWNFSSTIVWVAIGEERLYKFAESLQPKSNLLHRSQMW